MAASEAEPVVIGGEHNFWLRRADGSMDLTHPASPGDPLIYPRIALKTSKAHVPITIDPAKTALVVVDLQNYFLSPELGRPKESVGLAIVDRLVDYAIPACRKAGIPIVWLSWGLTDKDLDSMPPAIVKGFAADTNFSGPRRVHGLGSPIGPVELSNGEEVDGGRVLMQRQWNSEVYAPLKGLIDRKQDLEVYKNRLSGFWGGTGIEEKLAERGIRMLLFAGANLDQCVALSLQDAFSKGWDCLLLSDACATTSPEFARRGIEFNCEEGWGFMLTCDQLLSGVDGTLGGPEGEG
ncbi:hypothetical protein MMC10_008827 [Thelotrema lepadinum]|nr:hypothetical protein [Thelotrema lepadinum]